MSEEYALLDFPRDRRGIPVLQLVPLIDITFLIMVFFLLTNSFEPLDIVPVELPMATSGSPVEEGPLTVVLGRRGEIVVADEIIEPEQFDAVLADAMKQRSKDAVVTLKVDSGAKAGILLDAMEKIRHAGGINLSLATQKP